MRVAEGLAAEIRRVWPEASNDPNDRIDLLVGVRTGGDVDLLIALDLETSRAIPGPRRANATSPSIACGLIAVEIKQLDASRFERVGNELFARYRDDRSHRSVSDQARDAAYGLKNFAANSGFPNLFVHAVAWLTELDPAGLEGIDPAIVGRTGWAGLLTAAWNQNRSLSEAGGRRREGVRAVRDRLLLRQTLTPLDRTKSERISRDALIRGLVDELAPQAGTATIHLSGHGGSGKTTALVLLATRLATRYHARVLILSFHHALCGDIRHVLEGMPEAKALVGDSIHVETATSFLLSLVEAFGADLPYMPDKPNKSIDFGRTNAVYREVAAILRSTGGAEMRDDLIAENRERFDWDHVLVDEAQDWTDDERDLLIAAYGSRRLVLADGLVQLIRRQTSCNWLRDVPKNERILSHLGESLRMQRNVALFVNAFAKAIGFSDWRVEPRAELLGGRVVILEGQLDDAPALVHALQIAAAPGKADPVDNLICVPHSGIVGDEAGGRRSRLAVELQAAGADVWDGCVPLNRSVAPASANAWRILQYDSCRGLEGWATLLLALDDMYANRLKHPNDVTTGRAADPGLVAKRWLLIPLTRAVHLLVVHVRDPLSPVVWMLREAVQAMPAGVVEWYAANDGASRLAGVKPGT
jgi:hypothetical protein